MVKYRKECRALVHMYMIECDASSFALLLCSLGPPYYALVAYHLQIGGMQLRDAVAVNCKMGATTQLFSMSVFSWRNFDFTTTTTTTIKNLLTVCSACPCLSAFTGEVKLRAERPIIYLVCLFSLSQMSDPRNGVAGNDEWSLQSE